MGRVGVARQSHVTALDHSGLRIEVLQPQHIPALAAVLRDPAVYRFLGGPVPDDEQFRLGLSRALAGPPPDRPGERWLHYLVRHADSGDVLGRLECTVTGRVAEVAFLFAPAAWGRGHARAGLHWLHLEVGRLAGPVAFWATTHPDNVRCRRLLERAGYREVAVDEAPPLATYDAGDLVFGRRVGG
jgi:RimJ/RimL family protein N-acetyltransferase